MSLRLVTLRDMSETRTDAESEETPTERTPTPGNEAVTNEATGVYDFLTSVLDMTAQLAWSKLGLQPDLATGKIAPHLGEAKVAIDLVAYLANTLEAQLDGEDRRNLQNLVRDLRMNFVAKSGTGA